MLGAICHDAVSVWKVVLKIWSTPLRSKMVGDEVEMDGTRMMRMPWYGGSEAKLLRYLRWVKGHLK